MLVILSPAKTLDFEAPLAVRKHTEPQFAAHTAALIDVMRRKQAPELQRLMHISERLATLNAARFRDWSKAPARQAVLAFMGDVYTGLDARALGARDLAFAQTHLRILSGLYGLLRPLDLIRPHRLEMGTPLATARGSNLYRFWGERPAQALNAQARALRTDVLINLASNEYFKAVDRRVLDLRVITPVFKDWSAGRYKVVSFFAKQARGLMARYIVETRARDATQLEAFDAAGYRFDANLSTAHEPVYTRRRQAAARA